MVRACSFESKGLHDTDDLALFRQSDEYPSPGKFSIDRPIWNVKESDIDNNQKKLIPLNVHGQSIVYQLFALGRAEFRPNFRR